MPHLPKALYCFRRGSVAVPMAQNSDAPCAPATLPMSPGAFTFVVSGQSQAALRSPGPSVYKALYATPLWQDGTERCVTGFVCDCYGNAVVRHDPPRLYDVTRDPGETRPLDPSTSGNQRILQELRDHIIAHEARLAHTRGVVNQFAWRRVLPLLPWVQPCCNFPYCYCTDPVYP